MGRYSPDEGDIILHPNYDSGYTRYDLSIKQIIESINDCNYPIDADNIYVDDDGNKIPIVDYIHLHGGGGGKPDAPDPSKSYRLEVTSSNGNIISGRDFESILSATLYENNTDVTKKINEKYFKWTRVSGSTTHDQQSDAEWNLRWAQGAKEIPITKNDVKKRALFNCYFVTEDAEEVVWVVDAYEQYKNIMEGDK